MKNKIIKLIGKSMIISKITAIIIYYMCKIKKINSYKSVLKYTQNRSTIIDVYYSIIRYGILIPEYFIYDFKYLNDYGRKQFIGNRDRRLLLDGTGSQEARDLIDDKYSLYKKFKDYYKREMITVSYDDYKLFSEFCQKYKSIIVKPYNSMQGEGIRIVNYSEDLNIIWNSMFSEKNGSYVLEELIIQSSELGALHPSSINTIRLATYNFGKNKKIYNAFAFLRMGINDMTIDNLASGGISAIIDVDTGIINTPAFNMKKESFIIHPNSKIQIIGFKIPRWDELKEIANNLAKEIPDYNYISWDFALSEKGWVVVEANSRGGLYTVQMHGEGIRNKMMKCIKGE